MESVGLPEDCLEKSPFDLSGGQKRRVAIAGVLAMDPNMLIPGRAHRRPGPHRPEEILALVERWHQGGRTIMMVSHSMDDVAKYADRILVMNHGTLAMQGTPREVFTRHGRAARHGLGRARGVQALRRPAGPGPAAAGGGFTIWTKWEQAILRIWKGGKATC